jgi:hypothetical protein
VRREMFFMVNLRSVTPFFRIILEDRQENALVRPRRLQRSEMVRWVILWATLPARKLRNLRFKKR